MQANKSMEVTLIVNDCNWGSKDRSSILHIRLIILVTGARSNI